jgi:hypothetical protein
MIRMMLRKYFYLQSFSSRPVSRVNRPSLQGQWKESPHLGRKLLWIRFYRGSRGFSTGALGWYYRELSRTIEREVRPCEKGLTCSLWRG